MSRADNSWSADYADYDDPVPEGLWRARYQRAMNGATGLRRLHEMRAALEALPKRELCESTIADGETTCFVGAFIARRRADKLGVPLLDVIAEMHKTAVYEFGDGEDSYEDLSTTAEEARDAGLPWTVAWEWASMNDSEWASLTPPDRFERALAWVDERIAKHPLAADR